MKHWFSSFWGAVVAAIVILTLLAAFAPAQEASRPQLRRPEAPPAAGGSSNVTLPTGTHVMLVLRNALSSKIVKPGDAVYLQTSFPVMQDGRVAIPAGTYVQGMVDHAKRSGVFKGRAEVQMHFTHLVFPNGYMVNMVSQLGSADSYDSQKVEDKEGTVKAEGTKGRDAATIAGAAGVGGLSGGFGTGTWRGAGIGTGVGAAVGLATVLFTRGKEVRFEPGTSIEMVLQRPIQVDLSRVASDPSQVPPPVQRIYTQPQQEQPSTSPVPNTLPIPRGAMG